jgi:hypothetical protein
MNQQQYLNHLENNQNIKALKKNPIYNQIQFVFEKWFDIFNLIFTSEINRWGNTLELGLYSIELNYLQKGA